MFSIEVTSKGNFHSEVTPATNSGLCCAAWYSSMALYQVSSARANVSLVSDKLKSIKAEKSHGHL